MKRNIKNIICIALILIISFCIFLTMNSAKKNITSLNNNMPNMNEPGGNPPSMPNNSNREQSMEGNEKREDSNTNGSDMQTPPEKPSNDNNANGMTPPSKPDNDTNGGGIPSGNMPSMPNNMTTSNTSLTSVYYVLFGLESFSLAVILTYLVMYNFNKKNIKKTFVNSDKIIISVLSIVILTTGFTYLNGKITNDYFLNNSNSSGNNGPNMNQGGNNTSYSSVKEIKEDTTITKGTFESTTKDENVISVSGDVSADISNVTINKSGDSDGGDNTSFYGTNSAIIAKDKANLTLKGVTINTSASGANGVFSYGGSATTSNTTSDGTTVNISDSVITTTKDNSGGIMTTGGGIMNATNLTINTSGISSAAIRSDRGGGTVTVDGGTYTTTGQGSPSIYSTANINVKNATLVSKASEGIVIEGKNSVIIDNVTLEDTNNKLNGQSTTYKNIFLYQSMSGDADTGTSLFTASNSKITTNKGDTFYVTNTTATINLTNNTIVNNDKTGNFLRAQADSWGNNNSNGGNVTLSLDNQEVEGNIVIDSISTLDMSIKNKSSYVGTINKDNSGKEIILSLDKTSSIKLTGDSYVTKLDNADSTNSNIDFNGYKLYVNGSAIN